MHSERGENMGLQRAAVRITLLYPICISQLCCRRVVVSGVRNTFTERNMSVIKYKEASQNGETSSGCIRYAGCELQFCFHEPPSHTRMVFHHRRTGWCTAHDECKKENVWKGSHVQMRTVEIKISVYSHKVSRFNSSGPTHRNSSVTTIRANAIRQLCNKQRVIYNQAFRSDDQGHSSPQ